MRQLGALEAALSTKEDILNEFKVISKHHAKNNYFCKCRGWRSWGGWGAYVLSIKTIKFVKDRNKMALIHNMPSKSTERWGNRSIQAAVYVLLKGFSDELARTDGELRVINAPVERAILIISWVSVRSRLGTPRSSDLETTTEDVVAQRAM